MRHLEDAHQTALFQWARLYPLKSHQAVPNSHLSDYLIAIPNGGKRNVREAARLKRMGVHPGVSDIFLPFPNGVHHGLWIELKKPCSAFKTVRAAQTSVTPKQAEWQSRMDRAGYLARVCYGWMEARDLIVEYLT